MTKILVVTGSVRPNSVNSFVVEAIKADLATREGIEVSVANLGELNLPFFDAPTPPSADSYVVPHDSVERWGALVNNADGVVFAAAEYNHSLSAVQKNAIDWLYKEWAEKPVAFVGYGWYAGSHSLAQFKEIGLVTKWKLGETTTGLTFMKEIGLDGSFTEEPAVRNAIKATLDELVSSL
jgi:NAD(P)H-dependent FMN reductase